MAKISYSGPILTVRLTEGLAVQNRLPLEQVLRVLSELSSALNEAGQRLQRETGLPAGDFGLELIAGFGKGSVRASLAITRNQEVGVAAAKEVLGTVSQLRTIPSASTTRKRKTKVPQFNPRVVARLNNIAKIQEILHTKMALSLSHQKKIRQRAIFDTMAAQGASTYRAATLTVSGITLHGKFRELKDKSDIDQDQPKNFSGELVCDNGEVWGVSFKAVDLETATALFSRHVELTGTAHYYTAVRPKLEVDKFAADDERDYLEAFDGLVGSIPGLEQERLGDLIDEMRGGE